MFVHGAPVDGYNVIHTIGEVDVLSRDITEYFVRNFTNFSFSNLKNKTLDVVMFS